MRTFVGHKNYVFCVAFDGKANILASGSFDQTIKLWDFKTGRCIETFAEHTDPVTSVHFNKEGSLMVSGSFDGNIIIWDVRNHVKLRVVNEKEENKNNASTVGFVKFSPNGKYILASTWDNTIRLWSSFQDNHVLKTYTGHRNEAYCIFGTFSVTGGKWIVCGSEDKQVYIWDLRSSKLVQTLTGHTDVVLTVACHPNKNIIASGALSKDKSIKIWVSDT